MRLVSLLALLGVLVSCGTGGPIVEYCTINSEAKTGECSDGKEANEKTVPIQKLDNYVCMSPRDRQRFLNTCKRNQQNDPIGVSVVYCIMDCPLGSQACRSSCSDERIRSLPQLDNYSCLTPRHNEILMKYCKFVK
jgi:hypothetical protein